MNSPGAEVRIRPMTAADLDRVMAIAESLKDAPHWPPASWEAALDPHGLPRRIAMVAELDEAGGPAGFAVASRVGPEAELEAIAVAADAQRRGVARSLLGALAAELQMAGADVLLLEVRASNAAALSLYGSFGFVESGRRRRYYLDPEEDAVLMSLPVRGACTSRSCRESKKRVK